MTVLSWAAGFRLRTGWRFLSDAESVRLSAGLRGPVYPRLVAMAYHDRAGAVACLHPEGGDVGRARVVILLGAGRHDVLEEHASLSGWLRALGLLPAEPRTS